MNEVRAFVAVGLSVEVQQELARVTTVLAARVPERSVRWLKPESMHLTLCFLGKTAVSKLNAIQQAMDVVAQKQRPLELCLQGSGCFPHAKRPRVIWAGLAGQVAELGMVKQELDNALVPLGWEREKRQFKPHLTLGRVKDAQKLRGVSWEVEMKEIVVEITAVHLIKSQLTRRRAIYTVLNTSRFF